MRYNENKSQFIKAVYKICKEQSIDFMDFNPNSPTLVQKNIQNLFIRRNRINDFKSFLDFYNQKTQEEKSLVIVSSNQDIENWQLSNVNIRKKNIYGGFIYLDRKKFILLDRSYKNIINQMGKKYLELEKQREKTAERNFTYDNN